MKFRLESKKMRRTGFFPAFIVGGLTASAVPVLNMAIRSELYLGFDTPPIQTLLDANWQMMALFNILLVVAGACIMYNTEYMYNALQRITTLPIKESSLFYGKAILMVLMVIAVLMIESSGMAFCILHWFDASADLGASLFQNFGCFFLLMLPVIFLSLFIASACKNLWVSFGIGVVCVFTATMLPMDNFVMSLFPFVLPFQQLAGAKPGILSHYIIAVIVEIAVICIANVLFLKTRRSFE